MDPQNFVLSWPQVERMDGRVAVELCCGMGGIGIGLRAAGFQVAAAYDAWPEAVAVYNHNAPQPVASTCDLLTSEGRRTMVRDRRTIGSVDLVAAGPPCKGFSRIRNGKHHHRVPENEVLLAVPTYVGILRPEIVLVENVPDLMRHRGGRTFKRLLADLRQPGPKGLSYDVDFAIYDAALFGTPQARRRLIVLAVRRGSQRKFRLPPETPDLAPLYSAIRHGGRIPDALQVWAELLADPHDLSLTTTEQALSDLPMLGAGEPEVRRPYGTPPTTAYQEIMRRRAPNELHNTRTPAVRPETVERLKLIPIGGCARDIPRDKLNGLERRFDSAYRRLHSEAPSTALSTRYDCVYHYNQHRSLSVREYARLQGIPDYISFPEELACRRYSYEMIGNSVPPFLVYGVLSRAAKHRK